MQRRCCIDVYIITEDLGRLSLVTVETLIEFCATHIVLTSRSAKVKSYEGQVLQKKLKKIHIYFSII